MRIRTQLVFTVSSAIFLVAIASMYSAHMYSRAQQLKTIALLGEQSAVTAYRFEAASRAIQTATGNYKDSVKDWKAVYEDATKKLTELFTNTQTVRLVSESSERIATLKEKWQKIDQYISEIDKQFEILAQRPVRVYLNTLGLIKTQIQLSTDVTGNYEDFQLISHILDIFQSTVLFTVNITQDLTTLNSLLTKAADTASKQAFTITIISLFAGIGIALLVSMMYSTKLSKRIHNLEQVMESMAQKDISIETHDTSKDELGKLSAHINMVIEIMRSFMSKAQMTATSLSEVETALNTSSSELQLSSKTIVDNTAEISKRVHELDTNIITSTTAAQQVNTVLSNFIHLAESQANNLGRISTAGEEMAASMHNVSKLVESRLVNLQELQNAIAEGFDEADKSSEILSKAKHELEGISEISDMIADVADKTNILSMNAAIESAHAGISGKGFAVVAEEIRKLSDTASENASNIEKLVKNIAVSLSNSSQSAEQSRAVLAATKATVESFVSAFSEIGTAIKELNQASKEILEAVGNINASSLTIKQEGPKAAELSKKIEQSLAMVEVTSEQVVIKIAAIQESITTLSSALEQMNGFVSITSKRSSELDAMLCEFRVEKACEAEHEETSDFIAVLEENKPLS